MDTDRTRISYTALKDCRHAQGETDGPTKRKTRTYRPRKTKGTKVRGTGGVLL